MILSVHATFGAAVASLVPTHPVEAFALGFASHFLLDLIPHRDYDLISIESEPGKKPQIIETLFKKFRLIRDITLVFFDAIIGLILAFVFFFDPVHPWIFLIGSVGSLIPDFLTFVYIVIKHRSLGLFYDFHAGLIHSKNILKLNQVTGVFLQFLTVATLIALIFIVRKLFFI